MIVQLMVQVGKLPLVCCGSQHSFGNKRSQNISAQTGALLSSDQHKVELSLRESQNEGTQARCSQ